MPALTSPYVSAPLQKGKRKKDSLSVTPFSTPPGKLKIDWGTVVGGFLSSLCAERFLKWDFKGTKLKAWEPVDCYF